MEFKISLFGYAKRRWKIYFGILFRYKQVIERFTTSELINQAAFCEQFEKELRDGVEGSKPTDVFSRTEAGDTRLVQEYQQVTSHFRDQHNVAPYLWKDWEYLLTLDMFAFETVVVVPTRFLVLPLAPVLLL